MDITTKQLEDRLFRRIPYGGKKGRRALRRLQDLVGLHRTNDATRRVFARALELEPHLARMMRIGGIKTHKDMQSMADIFLGIAKNTLRESTSDEQEALAAHLLVRAKF